MKNSQHLSKLSFFVYTLRLIKPYWFLMLLATFFSTLASLTSGAIAWGVKPLFDRVFITQNYKYLKMLPFLVFLVFFVRALSVFLQAYFMKKIAYSIGKTLRARIYEKFLKVPFSRIDRFSSGEMISRIINDVGILESTVGDITRTFFLEGLTVIILFGVALYRSWELTLLVLLVVPGVIFISESLARKTHKRRHEFQKILARLSHFIGDSFKGLKEIKVNLQEKRLFKVFSDLVEDLFRINMKLVKYLEGTKAGVNLLIGVAGAIIVFAGVYLILHHKITAGDFFSMFTAILMVFSPIKRLSGTYNRFHECITGIERIEEIFSLEEERTGGKKIDVFKREMEFKNVWFRYPQGDRWALKEINLTIKKGEKIAIIGKSGAGKSTLVSLIPRFYDPLKGKVLIDGMDLQEVDLVSLRRLIGIVSQEIVIFNMTVYENIALGKPGATLEEVIEAAKLAYAHEFIEKLPKGYYTMIGEGGISLSGGQRQRIAIARAILKNPPILILDEATSHLDTVSERLVQKALESLMEGRTIIIIAHRLSTIRQVDRVIVMKEGKIICEGSHKELENFCEEYKKLYAYFSE